MLRTGFAISLVAITISIFIIRAIIFGITTIICTILPNAACCTMQSVSRDGMWTREERRAGVREGKGEGK